MRECPYCLELFASKQRLISHLTKTNKCYSIESIGIPPILIELMGGAGHDQNADSESDSHQGGVSDSHRGMRTQGSVPLTGLVKTGDAVVSSSRAQDDKHECLACAKRFMTEANLNRHVAGQKCKKPVSKVKATATKTGAGSGTGNGNVTETGNGRSGSRLRSESHLDEVPLLTIDPIPFGDPYQAPSQRRAGKARPDVSYKPSPVSTSEGRPRPEHVYRTPQVPFDFTQTSGVRYIDRDDYFNYLVHTMGSKASAVSFIRNCAHRRLSGDVALIQKIHFEGRDKSSHPFDVTDLKSKTLYYKSSSGMVADDKGMYVRNCLIENIQNCYLKLCNHIISSNFDKCSTIFNDENHLKKIQEHLLELSDEKVKDRFLSLLIESVTK